MKILLYICVSLYELLQVGTNVLSCNFISSMKYKSWDSSAELLKGKLSF
jgi:hypothetical protein